MEVNEYAGDAVQHVGNHSLEYIQTVTTKLQEIVYAGGNIDDDVNVLNKIREGLLDGTIRLN